MTIPPPENGEPGIIKQLRAHHARLQRIRLPTRPARCHAALAVDAVGTVRSAHGLALSSRTRTGVWILRVKKHEAALVPELQIHEFVGIVEVLPGGDGSYRVRTFELSDAPADCAFVLKFWTNSAAGVPS